MPSWRSSCSGIALAGAPTCSASSKGAMARLVASLTTGGWMWPDGFANEWHPAIESCGSESQLPKTLSEIHDYWDRSSQVQIDSDGLRPTARDPYLQGCVEEVVERA